MRDGGSGSLRSPRARTLLTIALLALGIAGCSQQTHAGSAGTSVRSVTIRNQSGHDPFGFSPKTLTVASGTRVVWHNRSGAPHTVTALGDHPYFSSGVKKLIARHHSWAFTFRKPGRYPYYCIVHPFMKGTIIVRAGKPA